jgi:fatty acid-binding protein DegV
MSKFAIVTDSTAFLPTELIQKHNITVTPQVLIWGERHFATGWIFSRMIFTAA